MNKGLLDNPTFKKCLIWLGIITGAVLSWVYALYPYIIKPLLGLLTKS